MLKFLAKIFIRNHKDTNNIKVRKAYGLLCSLYGIITNFIISALKVIFGLITSSIAIMADGINNLLDSISSVITMVSFSLSALPPDERHPYGHQRMEYIGGLIISFAMFGVGTLFLQSSIRKIINPVALDLGKFNIILIILIFSILIKITQYIIYSQTSKLLDSQGLKASAIDSFGDILITSTVAISLVAYRLWSINVDGLAGLLVAIFIIYHSIHLIVSTISLLLGEAPKKEFVLALRKKILAYPGVLGLHDLLIHSYGPNKTFVTVHIEVDSKIDIMTNHELMDKIEYDFLINEQIDLLIHMDPIDKDNFETIALEQKINSLIKEIDSRLELHDFRLTKKQELVKLLFDVAVPAKFELKDEELKKEIIKKIHQINDLYIIIITIDHHYFI